MSEKERCMGPQPWDNIEDWVREHGGLITNLGEEDEDEDEYFVSSERRRRKHQTLWREKYGGIPRSEGRYGAPRPQLRGVGVKARDEMKGDDDAADNTGEKEKSYEQLEKENNLLKRQVAKMLQDQAIEAEKLRRERRLEELMIEIEEVQAELQALENEIYDPFVDDGEASEGNVRKEGVYGYEVGGDMTALPEFEDTCARGEEIWALAAEGRDRECKMLELHDKLLDLLEEQRRLRRVTMRLSDGFLEAERRGFRI
jgi:hypothetical protein